MTTNPVSPNTAPAKALHHAEDVLAPRTLGAPPERIVLVVGTQINGAPHIGNSLVQPLTFAMAARLRDRFGLPTEVLFSALDNAPHELATDPASGHRYQRAYAQAHGEQALIGLVTAFYHPLFTALSRRLGIPHRIETYTQQQAGEHYRRTWLRLLPRIDAARWWLAPLHRNPAPPRPLPAPWLRLGREARRTHPHPPHRPRIRVYLRRQPPPRLVRGHHHAHHRRLPRPGHLYRSLVKELALSSTSTTSTSNSSPRAPRPSRCRSSTRTSPTSQPVNHSLPHQGHRRDLRHEDPPRHRVPDFEALLDGEGPSHVNPTATRDQQLADIRTIYGPEKEALGALAIEIERVV